MQLPSGQPHFDPPVPNQTELAFIRTANDIKAARIASSEHIPRLNPILHSIAKALFQSMQRSGLQGFFNTYNLLAPDYPSLEALRSILEVPLPAHRKYNPTGPTYRGTLIAEVMSEDIKWLWQKRLALGKITLLDGDPGVGKSTITLDLARRVTMGTCMPDGSPGLQGGVVLICLEDNLKDTIRPRLLKIGADLTKIASIASLPAIDLTTGLLYNRPFRLSTDLPFLAAEMQRVDAKLLIIDPVMTILSGSTLSIPTLLAPLQSLIEQQGTACLLVRHLSKLSNPTLLYRGTGPMAFAGLARSVLLATKDPTDETRCLLAQLKSNDDESAPTLSYRITSDKAVTGDKRAYVSWEGTNPIPNSQLLAKLSPKSPLQTARNDILHFLQGRYPEQLTPPDIAQALPDLTMNNLYVTLKRMVEDGQITRSARGLYAAFSTA
ncbi:MAG: AAA family ATPase [Chloroflexi bacterium]|nr:AAA family ATPase [Chloroflexota bacterium]